MVITMIGCFFGIVLTFPVAKIVGSILSAYFPVFKVDQEVFYMDIAASIAVGLLAAIVPTWRAIKIRIADGLRRIG
jgi:putative ABC transport system permease protein